MADRPSRVANVLIFGITVSSGLGADTLLSRSGAFRSEHTSFGNMVFGSNSGHVWFDDEITSSGRETGPSIWLGDLESLLAGETTGLSMSGRAHSTHITRVSEQIQTCRFLELLSSFLFLSAILYPRFVSLLILVRPGVWLVEELRPLSICSVPQWPHKTRLGRRFAMMNPSRMSYVSVDSKPVRRCFLKKAAGVPFSIAMSAPQEQISEQPLPSHYLQSPRLHLTVCQCTTLP